MEAPEWFVMSIAAILAALFGWAFRALPGERWQFLVAVPLRRNAAGAWHGLNLTYYGVFNALAAVLATAMVFVMLGALGVPATAIAVLLVTILAVAIPAARLVAAWVEGKAHTLSIAGAFGAGLLIAPEAIWVVNHSSGHWLPYPLPLLSTLAALVIAYVLGEGVGRLACISFGCCYGRPLHSLPPAWRRHFEHLYFRFSGNTKKICYASNLEGQRVVPIQAMTAVLLSVAGLVGLDLFLRGHHRAAYWVPMIASQLWRFVSEFLRADHRGSGKISAYQKSALLAMIFATALALLWPQERSPHAAILSQGLATLWQPAILLGLQLLGIIIFLYTGRSRVTASTLQFHVVSDKV